ncbi:MAG: alpha/beta fold hydrolase [Betaproteobacteria bacterium]
MAEADTRSVRSFDRDIGASRIDAVLAFDCADRLSEIRAPTLVIAAKDDILTPPHFAKFIAERIPNASLSILDYGAHRVAHVSPRAFNSFVLSFLLKQKLSSQ